MPPKALVPKSSGPAEPAWAGVHRGGRFVPLGPRSSQLRPPRPPAQVHPREETIGLQNTYVAAELSPSTAPAPSSGGSPQNSLPSCPPNCSRAVARPPADQLLGPQLQKACHTAHVPSSCPALSPPQGPLCPVLGSPSPFCISPPPGHPRLRPLPTKSLPLCSEVPVSLGLPGPWGRVTGHQIGPGGATSAFRSPLHTLIPSSSPGFVHVSGDTSLVAVQGPVPGPPSGCTGAWGLPAAFTSAATHFKPIVLAPPAGAAR